jgi:hypothetical protein
VARGGVLFGEGVDDDFSELLQHRTWRGGEDQRGNWAENPGRQSSPRGHSGEPGKFGRLVTHLAHTSVAFAHGLLMLGAFLG